jgi:CubicO group peptidase (beta-lactamase class C family)
MWMSRGCVAKSVAAGDVRARIEEVVMRLHRERLFAGAILVAEKGTVVYQGGFGPADLTTGRSYTPQTRSCLASLSKPITAVAVMMLAQAGQLAFDDPLAKHLPGFTNAVGEATLRHLLTHTSGIPDYPQLNVDHPGVTNAEIVAALRKVTQPSFPPGQKYEYSNSGYVLLALAIEAISRQSLPQFLEAGIFTPLGMASTFVLTSPDQKTGDVARGYDRKTGKVDDFEGMATGESGVYSTVGDLLRFDQALYGEALVSSQMLAEAFVPASVREGTTTYGLGWNIVNDAEGQRVWHQGNTAGFRAFIERRLRDRITVIMLTNGGDTNRMAINAEIQKVLRDG